MARDIKDELQSEPLGENKEGFFISPIQLQVTPELEKTLLDIFCEDYESAKRYRDKRNYGQTSKGEKLDFDKWKKSITDLYYGIREAKTIPWKFCSNRSLKISASIVDMLLARLFPVVYNEDLVRFRPGESTDAPKVERITKLMKWWVFVHVKMRNFFENWVKGVLVYGEAIVETSWKVFRYDAGEMEEIPITDEFGNQAMNPDGSPAMMEEKILSEIETSESRLYTPDKFLLQEGSKNIEEEPVILENSLFFRDIEKGVDDGIFVNADKLKEKLPVSDELGSALSPEETLALRNVKLRNYSVTVQTYYTNFDIDGDGFSERVRLYMCKEHKVYLGGIALTDLAAKGRQTLDYTKFSSRVEALENNVAEGVIEKIKELAEEIDAIFNQMSDANSLSILRPIFYDPGGDIDAPILKLAPNRMTPVSNPQANVFVPDITIRTDQLIMAIRLVLEFIERLTAASSYVLGKESEIVGGSGTATRTQAIVQSAEQRFQLPAERLREGAARIITHHLFLLQKNIPPGLENRILGEDMKPIFLENELSEEGISGEYDAFLMTDPSMGSQATERELAMMFYSTMMQNPIIGSDPTKIYKTTADVYKAFGKEPEQYLGPEPDFDLIDSPADENTLIVQGDFGRVTAQIAENHDLHIQKHMELLQSPSLASLPPHLSAQIVQFAQAHIKQHEDMKAVIGSIMKKFGGKSEAGFGPAGNGGPSPESSGKPGMEHTQGPLGVALDEKRKGEGGSYSPRQGQ